MNYIRIIILLAIVSFTFGCKKDDSLTPSTGYIKPADFLSNKKYKMLIVEINYVQGYMPTEEAVNNMVNFLSARLKKPKGVKVTMKSIPSPRKSSFSHSDVVYLEKMHRKHFPLGDILTAHILFLDAGYIQDTDNTKYLGMAYGATSMAIFQKTVSDYSGGITQPSNEVLETTIINHEFGHVLGLVNNGTSMQTNHQDTNHGHHCNNEQCLMYYATETTDIIGNLVGGNIPDLDQNCITDLKNNGGK
ncbi:MAG: membrane metalloprotease [Vicingaceae bacterium]|nr:membrane metalloprotease [Vicingaceae bacterium]